MVSDKCSRLRGSRTYGRGRKAGRGAGKRGGTGNAGLSKHKKMQIHKHTYFGRHGFAVPQGVIRRREYKVITLETIHTLLVNEVQSYNDEDGWTLDLPSLYNQARATKLLNKGVLNVHVPLTIVTTYASESVIRALESQGITVEVLRR